MWVQSVPVAMTMKPASPIHGSRRASSVVSRKLNIPSLKLQPPNIPSSQTKPLLSSSYSVIAPSVQVVRALRIQPSAELGLVSLLLVISTAFAAFFAVAIVSIPTIDALRKLATSMEKLSHVVSQEVPATLFSLKLSGLEVNDLTKQLTSLRKMISTTGWGKNSK